MSEHLSNGQFAPKDVTESAKNGRKRDTRFKKGNPGRPKGCQNKTTRKVKEFLAALCDDADVQEAVQARILKGDAVAFFRALEHVVGKPKENSGEPLRVEAVFRWEDE